jgi:hypothetical protein
MPGNEQVGQHQVGMAACRQMEPLLPVGGLDHLVAAVVKRCAGDLTAGGLVVDD